jgi:hypothetical protein
LAHALLLERDLECDVDHSKDDDYYEHPAKERKHWLKDRHEVKGLSFQSLSPAVGVML